MKYLKKIVNRAKTGIYKPFFYQGVEYGINRRNGAKWELWIISVELTSTQFFSIIFNQLTIEGIHEAICTVRNKQIIHEIHDS